MRALIPSVASLAGLFAFSLAQADTVTFEFIPGALGANDMSPDGRYIVGVTPAFEAYHLDRFTQQMLILVGTSQTGAAAVSDDGQFVLSSIPTDPAAGDDIAAIYSMATAQWTSLGYLPNALLCPSRSSGYELSADGSVAVGLSWDGCSGRGFRWTKETGMVELESLANGNNRASVCSADGNVIGGFAQGSFSRTPTLWNASSDGQLLDPPNGDALGEGHGMNDAGTILLGNFDQQAVTWTAPNWDRTLIGAGSILPGWVGVPQDIADNGTIVGFDFLFGNRRAWIQPYGVGPLIDLKSYVEVNGGIVPADLVLEVCQAISADGRTLIGHGFGTGAWIITITPSCGADIAPSGGNGTVDVDDLLVVINTWGQGASSSGDITGNGVVDVDDLLEVINAWGSCPGAQGACCTNDACTQLTESECASAGGSYLGNFVPCSPVSCSSNDLCADAVDITANINGDIILGDNSIATPPFGGGDPELPVGSPSCHWSQNPQTAHATVWYSFTAPKGGSVTISTCGTTLPFRDSVIVLYSGTCGKLVEIGCDEDGCPASPSNYFYSQLFANDLIPGEKYYFSIMNPGDWSGSVPGPFSVSITSP